MQAECALLRRNSEGKESEAGRVHDVIGNDVVEDLRWPPSRDLYPLPDGLPDQ